MSKKKSTPFEPVMDAQEEGFEVDSLPEAHEPALPAPEPHVYFETVNWKNVRTVYRCTTCGACRDERDAMVLHVLLHLPPAEQNRVFETLMKEN